MAEPSGSRAFGDAPILALAALVAAGLFFTPTIFNDPDTYWHLATGEWVLRHRAVLTTDPFSWSFTGQFWTAHEWLADVLMALGLRVAGWSGVAILTGLAGGAVVALIGLYLRRALPFRAALIFLIFIVFGMAPSLLARPHLFALPILTLWLIGLLEARAKGRAPSLWLLPLMLVWVNVHGSFVVGLVLVGPFALEALIETPDRRMKALRDWALFGVAALVLTLANPQGLQGILFPFKVMSMDALPFIVEWQSTRFDTLTPFQAVLFEGLFFALWLGVRVPPLRLLLLLGMLYLALSQVRHQIIFVVVASLLLRDPFAQALKARLDAKGEASVGLAQSRAAAAFVAIGVVAAMAVRLALPIDRGDDPVTPQTALASVPAEVRGQRVLNGYNLGGYLIFRGVPTFIDGRADMFGDAFIAQYSALRSKSAAELAKDLDKNKIGWSLLEPTDPLVRSLDQVQGWRRVYADTYAVVHARTSVEIRH